MQTLFAVAIGILAAAVCYGGLHAIAPLVFSPPSAGDAVAWLALGAPAVSLLLCGVVSGAVASQRRLVASLTSGIIATGLFLWFFSAAGYWVFFAAVFAIGLAVSLFGGLLGSRIPSHAVRAP